MIHWEVNDIQVILSPQVSDVRKWMKKHARFFGKAFKRFDIPRVFYIQDDETYWRSAE